VAHLIQVNAARLIQVNAARFEIAALHMSAFRGKADITTFFATYGNMRASRYCRRTARYKSSVSTVS
jgi:hypothetical protein